MDAAAYRLLSHREHVLLRPGMYIGSVEPDTCVAWVMDAEAGRMTQRELRFVPALYKMFDEVLVNAIDHAVRVRELMAKQGGGVGEGEGGGAHRPVRRIWVAIDRETGVLEVQNDGDGIDVVAHPEHGCHVPELIFGHLLTSANYDDEAAAASAAGGRTVGGQNGIGAKACNIFARWFEVETVDATRKRVYTQRWEDNMSVCHPPTIKACAKAPYTRVRFLPDYTRLGVPDGLDADTAALMARRAYDACAVTDVDVAVWLDGVRLECKSFERYVDLYLGARSAAGRAYERVNDWWEVAVGLSEPGAGLQHVSFVNGMATLRGGRHVEHVAQQVAKRVAALVQGRRGGGGTTIKPQFVRDNLFVFVRATVPNPTFDSQSKDTLTTPVAKFGRKVELSDKFCEKVYKLEGLADRVQGLNDAVGGRSLKKTDGAKRASLYGIKKLDDAEWAGTAKSAQCTLILTEGDSAKAMAVAGLSVVGRQKYGVFPLRGKVMNVCDVSAQRIADNEEITNVKKILGLQSGRSYADAAELRYGRVMVMTDQDSVTGDTPLLLRDPETGSVHIMPIDAIADSEWAPSAACGKEYARTRFEVWTERGWTPVVHVMRHRCAKRVFRVSTHTGAVDVTEDHSMLRPDASEVAPSCLRVGEELLHAFPAFERERPGLVREGLDAESKDEAYAMGLFWAGCDSPRGASVAWSIPGADAGFLERAKARYGALFHDDHAQKRIPSELLNAPEAVRCAFLEGVWDGNGDGGVPEARAGVWMVDVVGKIGAMGLFYLSRSLGLEVCVDIRTDQPDVYRLHLFKDRAVATPLAIRQIVDMGVDDRHVYDLETANHHFHAGVGQLIVHNTDGSHIKGLLMNLFLQQWPSLLKLDGFMCSMLTPVVKAWPTDGRKDRDKHELSFFNLPDFAAWRAGLAPAEAKRWRTKYYKGLGTSTPAEAKEYFKRMRIVAYRWDDDGTSRGALDLAFNKARADDRKAWLQRYDPAATLDYGRDDVSYAEFVDRDLVHFSNGDLARSIPSVVDGLKPSQRKVLFACLKRNLKDEIRVAQLAGYVSEQTAYHHGEASLHTTIVGMAQDYVGANNIALLQGVGQFGTRLAGGHDAASPRYIHTHLGPLCRALFPEADDAVLRYLDDDGVPVEPQWYMPILPLVLINGAVGIGTGYSCNVPCHDPLAVCAAVRALLAAAEGGDGGETPTQDARPLTPWYRGYTGALVELKGRLHSRGVVRRVPGAPAKARITEAALFQWTDVLKEAAEALVESQPDVKAVANDSSDTAVDITVTFASAAAAEAWLAPEGDAGVCRLEKELDLVSHKMLSGNNMHLFSPEGRIRRYESAHDILLEHHRVRLDGYTRRREAGMAALAASVRVLEDRIKFLDLVISGELELHRRASGPDLDDELEARHGLARGADGTFRHLLAMQLGSMTADRKAALEAELATRRSEHADLQATTPARLWLRDLDEFCTAYTRVYA